MSVELIKKPVSLYQVIDEQQKEELMEAGIIVPDSKPDVLDVLAADTRIVVKTREKTGRVMEIGGEILYQVLYRADNQEQSMETINVSVPWSVSCSHPAREEDADIHTVVRSSVEHTNVEIVNGRKLSARSVVKLNVKFLSIQSVEAGDNIQGENVYQKAEQQDIMLVEDTGERNLNISELLELPAGKPAIGEILYWNSALKEPKITENDMVELILSLNILYRPDNDSTQVENASFEIPVTKSLDMENNYTGLMINAELGSLNVKPDEDLDGLLTRVRIDGEVNIEYVLYASENINLINDAYSPDYDFELEKKTVAVSVEEQDMSENIQVKADIPLECGGDNLDEVLNVCVKPRLLSAENDGTGIQISGCLDIFVLYGTGSNMRVLRGANQEVQFTHRMALPEANTAYDSDVKLIVNSNAFDILSGNELGIKADITVKLHLSRKAEISIVTGIKGVKPAERKEKPPILVYYTQEGDTLWSIARKYRVPIQKIMNDNGMTEETEPVAGQKIFLIS